MAVVGLLLVFVCFDGAVATSNLTDPFPNCVYDPEGNPPRPGLCKGPLMRNLAKRHAVRALNRGCDLAQVFFVANGLTNQTRCGECVPGTNGNWRFSGVPSEWSRILHVQHCYRDPLLSILKCDSPLVSVTTPYFFCGINEFCNDDGRCVPMAESSLLDRPCAAQNAPSSLRARQAAKTDDASARNRAVLAQEPEAEGMDMCGAHGLACVSGACRVCADNSLQRHNADRTQSSAYSGYCLNGRYTMSKWRLMLSLHGDIETYLVLVLNVSFFFVAFGRKCKSWIAILHEIIGSQKHR